MNFSLRDDLVFTIENSPMFSGLLITNDLAKNASNEEILQMVDFFRGYGSELRFIDAVRELGFSVRYLGRKGLMLILESNFSTDEEKVGARYLLDNPHEAEYPPKPKQVNPKSRSGYVYLAHSETGHYKIGISKYPSQRIDVMDTKMPIRIELVHTFHSDDYKETEKGLHKKFDAVRVRGEWFDLSQDDVLWIQSIAECENGELNFIGEER